MEEKEKLDLLLKELNLNRNTLSIELGYKNSNSIHRIYRGESSLSSEPIFSKILTKFPYVSADFLKNGNLPIMLSAEEKVIQDNLLYPHRNTNQESVSQSVAMMLFAEIKSLRDDIKELKKVLNEKSSN